MKEIELIKEEKKQKLQLKTEGNLIYSINSAKKVNKEEIRRKISTLITKWMSLDSTSGDHLVQPPAKRRVNENRLLKTLSS